MHSAPRPDTPGSCGSGTSGKSDTRYRTPHTPPCRAAPSTRCGIAPCTPALSAAAASLDVFAGTAPLLDRKSTRLNSSHLVISYAVFCLKKKKKINKKKIEDCFDKQHRSICYA